MQSRTPWKRPPNHVWRIGVELWGCFNWPTPWRENSHFASSRIRNSSCWFVLTGGFPVDSRWGYWHEAVAFAFNLIFVYVANPQPLEYFSSDIIKTFKLMKTEWYIAKQLQLLHLTFKLQHKVTKGYVGCNWQTSWPRAGLISAFEVLSSIFLLLLLVSKCLDMLVVRLTY